MSADDMSTNIGTGPSLDEFFENSVETLPDNHYTTNDSECPICGVAEQADPPETLNQMSSISSTSVISTKACSSPHTFHKLCLCIWLHSQLSQGEDATCPACRQTLILSETIQAAVERMITRYEEEIEESIQVLSEHEAQIRLHMLY
ncbi:hypothetical protein BDW02DRAFT_596951 [Decorospora gaudefroyi]|uniref:Uncharacterized protein n=1 Tax=Decorospora gaudefroyi TaxID=184978 RepID=A0A6A5KQD5_9PLEO|nr:hypothetical protein BDW02DRAFT_596951 [Decorospora gaudefroyi]